MNRDLCFGDTVIMTVYACACVYVCVIMCVPVGEHHINTYLVARTSFYIWLWYVLSHCKQDKGPKALLIWLSFCKWLAVACSLLWSDKCVRVLSVDVCFCVCCTKAKK